MLTYGAGSNLVLVVEEVEDEVEVVSKVGEEVIVVVVVGMIPNPNLD